MKTKHIGDDKILNGHKTAVFCSRKAHPDAILRTLDLAQGWRDAGKTIIGGFHSPVEQEVLHILLKGTQPIIICPARCVENMRIPREWRKGIEAGRILVLSPFETHENRVSSKLCDRRNEFVANLADAIFIADVAEGGKMAALAEKFKLKLLATRNFRAILPAS